MTEQTSSRIPASLVIFLVTLLGTVIVAGLAVSAGGEGKPLSPRIVLIPVLLFALIAVGVYAGIREKFPEKKRALQNRIGLVGNVALLSFYLVFMIVATMRVP